MIFVMVPKYKVNLRGELLLHPPDNSIEDVSRRAGVPVWRWPR